MMKRQLSIEFTAGIRTALADGTLVPDSPKHMATEHLYKAMAGSRIALDTQAYLYAVALFSLERDEKYLYTYDYQCESNWTTYLQNLTPDSYTNQPYIFEQECYFRICMKRKDGRDITSEDVRKASIQLQYPQEKEELEIKQFFEPEIEKTAQDILDIRNQKLAFCLLSDTHYTVNGTWEDTASNIKAVHDRVKFDAIIHLGDVTDGLTSAKVTSDYVEMVMNDLHANNTPVHMVLGNHDSNYFRGNKEKFTVEKQIGLYLREDTTANPYYYVDYPADNLRCLFLPSFDYNEPLRYGFSEETIVWLKDTLESMNGGNVLVFSHEAPFAELDYWSYLIRNGDRLVEVLEEYNKRDEYHILGYFYGHVHADSIYEGCSFPIVSIGCNKLEYFTDKKPQGAVTPKRIPDTVTQDLWDTMIIDMEMECIHMLRFGAGEDRIINCSKKESTRKHVLENRKRNRKTKVWAHRGASAYAPENTLPAFELAAALGCDGVELDVQLSKDGVPVIIHDESIDRVSDGQGLVCNYTLHELKQFNFNRNFPLYGSVTIPTLEELYNLLKDTDLTVNVELKNHFIFYEGLEEKVLSLASEYNMQKRIVYSSFNHLSMLRIRQLREDARIAFLYRDGLVDVADYAYRNKAYAIHPERHNIKYPGFMKACRKKGIKVHVWNVNEELDMEHMIAAGVDAVITNRPDLAMNIADGLNPNVR